MAFQNRLGTGKSGRVNGANDLVTSSSLWRWTIEGKVFEAGYGLEDSAITSEGAVNDLNVAFTLQAPAASDLLVIPIMLKICIIADGSSLTTFQVLFTKPAELCATKLAISGGTALTSKHCLYRTNPALQTQRAESYSAATSTALVAADYISYHRGHVVNAVLTSGLVAMGEGPSNVHTFRFLQEGAPHILTSGAAMMVHVNDAATDTTSTVYMQWAEVTEDDLY